MESILAKNGYKENANMMKSDFRILLTWQFEKMNFLRVWHFIISSFPIETGEQTIFKAF